MQVLVGFAPWIASARCWPTNDEQRSPEHGQRLAHGEVRLVEVAEGLRRVEHVGGLERERARVLPSSVSDTSSQRNGVDTCGRGCARSEYAHIVVL